jgi:electron transfer flavoprotein alpha subunit
MSEVLVLIDVADGKATKPSLELLTIARRIGTPSAVVFGSDVPSNVAEYGAEKVYQLDDSAYEEYLVGPKAEALAQLIADKSPAATLVVSTNEGKEIAARAAQKSNCGFIADAVDVDADGTTTQSVFAGNYTVKAKVTEGIGPDTVFVPFHFAGWWQGEDMLPYYPEGAHPVIRGEAVNTGTTYGYDSVTMMQETKTTICNIERVA